MRGCAESLLMMAFLVVSMAMELNKGSSTDIDEYRSIWDTNGSSFELVLLSSGTRLTSITGSPFQNFTSLAMSTGIDGGEEFVPMMLEEAAGGRCDACVVLVRELWKLTTEVLKEHGQLASSTDKGARAAGAKHVMKLDMEDPAVARRYMDICRSEAYRVMGAHTVKGCLELLSEHSASIMDRISKTMQMSMLNYPQLPDATCTQLLGICPKFVHAKADARTVPPSSPCRSCATMINELHLRLRNDARDGRSIASDPMSLNKLKPTVLPYMSPAHIRLRLEVLCEDIALNMLVPLGEASILTDYCETLLEDHEDAIVEQFSAMAGKWQWEDPVAQICVQAANSCTANQFSQVHQKLSNRWAPGVTTPPDLVFPVHKEAFQFARRNTVTFQQQAKSTKSTPQITKATTEPSVTQDELEEHAHMKLEQLLEAGHLSQSDHEQLLTKLYRADKVLLRVFKFEKKKSDQELAMRLKLIVDRKAEL